MGISRLVGEEFRHTLEKPKSGSDERRSRFRFLVLPIVLAWAASAALRWWTFDDRLVPVNASAPYHVLLTVEALRATPASVHRFLPLTTLGRDMDRHVPFGASIEGPGGIFYYTSFSAIGFLLPKAFFALTGLAPTVRHLMLFNFLVHLAATLLVALLAWEIVSAADEDGALDVATRRIVAMLVAIAYLFSREALYAHGVAYWHHSLFQVAWLAQLIALRRVLDAAERGTRPRRRDVALLVAMSFVGPLTEWTGFFATAAAGLVLVWRSRTWAVTLAMASASIAAMIAFVGHLASVLGLRATLAGMMERAAARSAVYASPGALARGYVDSFGAPLLLLAAACAAVYFATRADRMKGWIAAMLIAVTAPLVENVVLAAHATDYRFDRLKALVTLLVVLSVAVTLVRPVLRARMIFASMVIVAAVVIRSPATRFGGVIPPLSSNAPFVARLRSAAKPCAVYGTDARPGAAVDLEIGANLYEQVEPDSLARIATARGACQAIHLRMAVEAGEGLYIWRRATIQEMASGRVDTVAGTPRRQPRLRRPEPDPGA